MKSDKPAQSGHLKTGGPLILPQSEKSKEVRRRATKRWHAEMRQKPVVLDWGKK